MSSEIIKISRPNETNDGIIEQYPVTVTNAIYDSINEQFLNVTITELMSSSGNESQVVQDLRNEVTQQLGQIEDDIERLNLNKIDIEVGKGLSTNDYTNEEKNLTAQIPQKANQSYVDAQFTSIVSGSPKGTYATLSALRTAYPTGSAGVYVILADGKWYYWNSSTLQWTAGGLYQSNGIADNSISPQKITQTTLKAGNLFNKQDTDILIGYFLMSATGASVQNNEYAVSGYIPVKKGDIFTSNIHSNEVACFYDSNKNYLQGLSVSNTPIPLTFTIPNNDNIAYMRYNIKKSVMSLDDCMIVRGQSLPSYYIPYSPSEKYSIDWLYTSENNNNNKSIELFKDKTFLVSGDSITEFNFRATKNWHDFLKEWLNLKTVKNDGKSGTGIIRSFGGNSGMYYRADTWNQIYGEFDTILIMGNMNDGGIGSTDFPVGNFSDRNPTQSQYGALHSFIQKLLTNYPNKPIGWIISQPRKDSYENQTTTHSWGKDSWFEPYSQAILEVCDHYSIPCLDLYHNSGLRPWLVENNKEYFSVEGVPNGDGTHPNTKGQEVMAYKINEFVKQYMVK